MLAGHLAECPVAIADLLPGCTIFSIAATAIGSSRGKQPASNGQFDLRSQTCLVRASATVMKQAQAGTLVQDGLVLLSR